jgi:hypothetical protein
MLVRAQVQAAAVKFAAGAWWVGTRSLGLDDLPEASNQALVVLHGIKLDACLDHINGAHAAVSDRAAQTAAKRAIQIVPE